MITKILLYVVFDDGSVTSKLLSTENSFENIIKILQGQNDFSQIDVIYYINLDLVSTWNSWRKYSDDDYHFVHDDDANYPAIQLEIDKVFDEKLPQQKSSIIFRKLLSLSKTNDDLSTIMYSLKRGFDKGKDSAFSMLSLKSFESVVNDSPDVTIVIVKEGVVYSILEREEPEDSEFYGDLVITYGPKIKIKQLIKELSKPGFEIYLINNFRLSQGRQSNKTKYNKFDVNYDFERKNEKRNRQLKKILFLKCINESFVYKADINPESSEEVLDLVRTIFGNMYKYFFDKGLLHVMSYSNIELDEFDYDNTRNKLFLDIKMQYTFTDSRGDKINSRYNGIFASTTPIKTDKKLSIFYVTLCKLMGGYANGFSRLFKDNNLSMEYNNYHTNGFDKELVEKYCPKLGPYSLFLKR